MRRLPKRGFSNYPFRKKVYIVDLGKINNLKEAEVDSAVMLKYRLIKNVNYPVKVLSNGNLDKAKTITANSFSHSALEKIEKAGGKAINI
jgi:large subunit ribosomal protein L15